MSVWGRGRGGANGMAWGNGRGSIIGNGNGNNNAADVTITASGPAPLQAAAAPSVWPATANGNPWNRKPHGRQSGNANNVNQPIGSAAPIAIVDGSLTEGVQRLQIRNIPQSYSSPKPVPAPNSIAITSGPGRRPDPSRRQPREEEGRRGRRPTFAERNDFVATCRNVHMSDLGNSTKVGTIGTPVPIIGNYFKLKQVPDWCIFQYHVDFRPEQTNTKLKRGLIDNTKNKQHLGGYATDGSSIWTAQRLAQPLLLTATTRRGELELVEMDVKLVGEVDDGDPRRIQIFNVITRSCFGERDGGLGLVQNRRNYYDPAQQTVVTAVGRYVQASLTIWPGYVTTLRHYDQDLMLNVGIKHKIIRNETCLDRIRAAKSEHDILNELVGAIVMTRYNNRSYKIADVDFNRNPTSTFSTRDGSARTYVEYYQTQHQVKIRDTAQPLLMAQLKKKDFHRGGGGGAEAQFETIYLIPELCNMTGITETERSDYQFMNSVNAVVMQNPTTKLAAIQAFIARLCRHPGASGILKSWGLEFEARPVRIEARALPPQSVFMQPIKPNERENGRLPYRGSDWTMEIVRGRKMNESMVLSRWVIIQPSSVPPNLQEKLRAHMTDVSRGLGFGINAPLEIVTITARGQNGRQPGPSDVQRVIQTTCAKHRSLQLLVFILPTNDEDLYVLVKKECCTAGVHSQCVVANTIRKDDSKFKSVATNIVIQINAKLGGVPWKTEPPFKTPTMVVGFDVYHCGKASGRSVGAMVATRNGFLSKFYSTATWQERGQELSTTMCTGITKCVDAFCRSNGKVLPKSIIFFRDGVGEGQLHYVVEVELQVIKDALRSLYGQLPPPKLTFIVVTKRINARFFKPSGNAAYGNVEPGTIVDTVATQPERYDFFLSSTRAPKAATASPTSYNVVCDDNEFSPNFIHELTYRQCHGYFNWSGTVSVPAVCQYAHKLAFLTGTASLTQTAVEGMSNTLYYL